MSVLKHENKVLKGVGISVSLKAILGGQRVGNWGIVTLKCGFIISQDAFFAEN